VTIAFDVQGLRQAVGHKIAAGRVSLDISRRAAFTAGSRVPVAKWTGVAT
jgi:hypothetical protein